MGAMVKLNYALRLFVRVGAGVILMISDPATAPHCEHLSGGGGLMLIHAPR